MLLGDLYIMWVNIEWLSDVSETIITKSLYDFLTVTATYSGIFWCFLPFDFQVTRVSKRVPVLRTRKHIWKIGKWKGSYNISNLEFQCLWTIFSNNTPVHSCSMVIVLLSIYIDLKTRICNKTPECYTVEGSGWFFVMK